MQRGKFCVTFGYGSMAFLIATFWILTTWKSISLVFMPSKTLSLQPLFYQQTSVTNKSSFHSSISLQAVSSKPKHPLDNFKDFPCLYDTIPTHRLQQHGHCVRTIAVSETKMDSKWCTTLKIGTGTPICTYDPSKDSISNTLHRSGQWEKAMIVRLSEVLKREPNMMLFDVGSNIGVYCISAAFYHRHVVCLDANYENLLKLSQSLQRGQLTENATLIWNAVSNNHTTIHFHIARGNIGMSRIADLRLWKTETAKNMSVNSIMLDDLQDFGQFKKRPIFMKMDVEAHELYVLQGAEQFFKKVDVRIIQMELAEKATKLAVIELLEKYGFSPYRYPLSGDKLSKSKALNGWPVDVYFLKNSQTLHTV